MSKLKPTERKALAWYCEEFNLRPELSIIPAKMIFTSRSSGEKVESHLISIVTRYEHSKNTKKGA